MGKFLDEHSAREWIDGLSAFDRDNTIVLFCILAAYGVPEAYLDVGSGTGAMVNMAEKVGIEQVNGLDILPRPAHPKLLQVDLREPQHLGRQYEIVTSIETAEHIEPEYADTLVDTIVRHAGKRIIFTAAMPGQQGHGHFNLQSAEYWRTKFFDRGWDYNKGDTALLVAMLALAHHASHHIEANLQVFTRIW